MSTSSLLAALAASLLTALGLVLTSRWHQRWTADFEASGVQKHHQGSPPRVGGLAVLAGLVAGGVWAWVEGSPGGAEVASTLALLALCAVPVVGLGFLEDTTKRVSPRTRLVGAALSALAGMWVLGTQVPGVGISVLDPLVQLPLVAVLLTVLLVSGFTHAMNIVDGLNGLAGGLALMMLGVTAWAAHQAQDPLITPLCVLAAMAVGGFLLVNFPRGAIFLGDGGAYLLGFVLVQLWVLLVVRNPGEISPWFIVAVGFHPTMETIFSIIRRKLHPRKLNATAPDRLHLHTLVYRRKSALLAARMPWAPRWFGNALAGGTVVALGTPPALLALLAPGNTTWQLCVVGLAVTGYLLVFSFLVRWAGWRRHKAARPAPRAAARPQPERDTAATVH